MLSDCFLTPSRHSANALTHYLLELERPEVFVTPVSFGAGFSVMDGLPSGGELPANPYALFVSTIEVRKNHFFLARVWQRLIEKHGAEAIPSLLLVGRYGWKTGQFTQFLRATANLDGKIVVRSSMSDAELDRCYAECLFTVFPSLAEGWGLPVAESLAHGKACIASNATSIPEVGGDAADYFDPYDETAAMGAIERMLFEPGYRESREEWIRVHYQPRGWAETAAEILDALSRENAWESLHADR
jgi:glycosyltransferase involved in cell wall biosynthesis